MFNDKLIAPKIEQFVSNYVRSLSRSLDKDGRELIETYQHMLESDPISRFCIEVTLLYLFSMLGEYKHDRKKVEKDVRNSIANCKGSWREILKRMCSAFWYGFSWSEVSVTDTLLNRKILTEIHTLNPTKYEFAGENGETTTVLYQSDKELELDYNTGIHLVVGTDINFNYLYGCGRAKAAVPYMQLHELMMPVMAIAGQRQATPILVKKTDTGSDVVLINQFTGEPVEDEFGQQKLINKGWDAVQQLAALESSGVTAIDREDELFQIEPKIAEKFLTDLIKLCEQYRMLSFLVPSTLGSFSGSGVGDTSLAQTHLQVFEMMVVSMLQFLNDELIEQLIKPLIIYNFGEQSDYGRFEIITDDPQKLEIAKVALDVVKSGKIGLDDIDTINLIREKLGLSDFDFTLVPPTLTPVAADSNAVAAN
jgi:hypothetical protein